MKSKLIDFKMITPTGEIINTKDSLNYITRLHIAINVIPEHIAIDVKSDSHSLSPTKPQNSPNSPTAQIIDFFSKFF